MRPTGKHKPEFHNGKFTQAFYMEK